MKLKFKARELLWMIAPVVLLGGGAWWLSRGGKMPHLQNPLDPGPIRIEFTPFEKVELSPFDVSQGFAWAAKTHVETVGKWDVPLGWKTSATTGGSFFNLKLVYRRGQQWKNIQANNRRLISLLRSSDPETSVFGVDLKTVPRDAKEVRLRGTFQKGLIYSGAIPPGWKPPKNMKIAGPNRYLTLESKPFDIQIKGPNEPFPKPVVSRAPSVEIVDAKWIVDVSKGNGDWLQNVIVLQLRRADGESWEESPLLRSQDLRLFDGNGREVTLLDSFTHKKHDLEFWLDSHLDFHPNHPANDLFAVLATGQYSPAKGWLNVKAPLRLKGKLSHGDSWPQKIDVAIPSALMKPEDFGGAK